MQVAHRLDGDKIRPRFRADRHRLGEGVVRGVELEVPRRLEELPGGADVERDESAASGGVGGLAGDGDAGRDHVRKGSRAGIFRRRRPESVGVHHVRAGLEIRFVDGLYILRPRKIPELRDLARLQAEGLKPRPHRAVENERFFQFREVEFHGSFILSSRR